MRVVLLFLAIALGITGDGSKEGRKGNALYRNQEHEQAAALFSAGLEDQDSAEPDAVHAGLWNNLGASLFRLGRHDEAKQAFTNAVALAPSEAEVARSAYNAGNNAYAAFQKSSQQQMMGGAPQADTPQGGQAMGQPGQPGAAGADGLEGALEFYKRAMLADPENEDAKFNYEFVKRQLQEQEQNQDQQQQQDQNNQDQENQDQQDQQNQQNQDEQQQNQDQQQQDQSQQQQDQQQQEQENQEQQQQQPQDPNKLSKEEAERILQALQNEEEELLRQVMKSQARPKKVEKDW